MPHLVSDFVFDLLQSIAVTDAGTQAVAKLALMFDHVFPFYKARALYERL
jgi:hypothetical protein